MEFFNELGKHVDLTVIFEAKRVQKTTFNWVDELISNYKAVFLSNGYIEEKKVDWKILSYINKEEYDIIVATNYSYYTETVALLKLIFKRIPFVFEIDGAFIRKDNFLIRNIKHLILSKPILYLSPSQSSDESLKYYGVNSSKIHRYPFTSVMQKDILPRCITSIERNNLRKELGIKEKRMVLYVGQFIFRKGVDVLLKAASLISNREDTAVVLIGGKPTIEYESIIKERKICNIYFHPFLDKKSLDKYFCSADTFVLPTREDTWGLVINEAMAYGLPIITTDNCLAGLELVENDINGCIVPIDDEKTLAEKIDYILENENLRISMSQNNLEKIAYFTIEEMVNRHMEIFKHVLSNK